MKLVAIGAFGKMLSPSAKHLLGSGIKITKVLDRKKNDAYSVFCRENWVKHGSLLVDSYNDLLSEDVDGIVICAGKNGDDYLIIKEVLTHLNGKNVKPFILHFSTVSSNFVETTYQYCKANSVRYANYPLTGGVVGAENANMLILASGDIEFYNKLLPFTEKIGKPKYFGEEVALGAQIKLIGHLMVFNNLMGICSALSLHTKIKAFKEFDNSQIEFFDFLNQGAGNSKQWDITIKNNVFSNNWGNGFLLKHALVDILYASELMIDNGIPDFAIFPLMIIALNFVYLVSNNKDSFATQSLLKNMVNTNNDQINKFMQQNLIYGDLQQTINNCLAVLPEDIARSVMFKVKY